MVVVCFVPLAINFIPVFWVITGLYYGEITHAVPFFRLSDQSFSISFIIFSFQQ